MRRHFLLAVLLIGYSFSSSLHAQILYKVNFHDKDNARYDGLMVYFNESSSYMRITYYSSDSKYQVVNVNYKSSTGTFNDGSTYFFMSGYSPRFITADSGTQKYNPDHFIWRKGKNETTWRNPSTTDDPKLSYESELPVDSFYQMSPNTVSETFLRRYFWDNEDDFLSLKKLCGLTAPTINVNPVNAGTKLHLIVVANTLIGDIGAGCKADRDKLDYEFKGVADALGMGYQKYIADENNFNKSYVESMLNTVNPGKNDIVIFVYRGHGFRWDNQTDAYPQMDLRPSSYLNIDKTTSLGLSEVYNTLKNKGARLNLVLADCCNNYVGINQSTTASFLNSQSDNKPDINKLKKLFLNAHGTLITAAAHSGEYSWSNPFGGFFTLSFIQAMKERISYMDNTNPDWTDVINYSLKLAKDKTSPTLCSNCTLQTGVWFVNVSY